MTIPEIQKKYSLSETDFWELPAKKGTWMIKHQALEHIADVEKIQLDPPVMLGYQPTIKTEQGIKEVENTKWGEKLKTKMNGAVQVTHGEVMLYVVGRLGNPKTGEIKTAWATGEANALNCTAEYYGAMAEKRAKDRVIIKLIDSENDIYSDVEGVPDEKPKATEPNESQIDEREQAIAELRKAKTQVELKAIFMALPNNLMADPEIRRIKDELKGELK